ncbi:MAG: hypothetical protein HYW90_00470 [Candidatus Sungbacteria bacterium]|nr:hypothetical protein [Candidatus Sungbacteria bacterium]
MDKEKARFGEREVKPQKSLSEIDEMIAKRRRGRVIGESVVPFEERMKELESKKAEHGGVLPPAEEDELRRLELDLKGPMLERRGDR